MILRQKKLYLEVGLEKFKRYMNKARMRKLYNITLLLNDGDLLERVACVGAKLVACVRAKLVACVGAILVTHVVMVG